MLSDQPNSNANYLFNKNPLLTAEALNMAIPGGPKFEPLYHDETCLMKIGTSSTISTRLKVLTPSFRPPLSVSCTQERLSITSLLHGLTQNVNEAANNIWSLFNGNIKPGYSLDAPERPCGRYQLYGLPSSSNAFKKATPSKNTQRRAIPQHCSHLLLLPASV